MIKAKVGTCIFASGLLLMSSCGSKEDEAASEVSLASASGVSELNISSALNLTLPTSMQRTSSTSLALTATKKSFEACKIAQTIDEAMSSLKNVATMFCHLEVESSSIEFGKKYNISITGGSQLAGESFQLYVDNTNQASGTIKVTMCSDKTVEEEIIITGLGNGKAKGSVVFAGSDTDGGTTWTIKDTIKFDLGYTTAGTKFLSTAQYVTDGSNSTFKRQVVLKLVEGSTSMARISNNGTFSGQSFGMSAASKINSEYGQTLFTDGTYTKRSYFDANGNIASSDATTAFASEGALYVKSSDVPKAISDSFTGGSFSADKWDCEADNDLTINMAGDKGTQHNACNQAQGQYVDCAEGATFASAGDSTTIDSSEQKDYDQHDDIADDSQ